jgi:hypothetical protein
MVLMIINLSPQRRDDTLEVSKSGNVLTVNGEVFDFSLMGEGDTLPRSAILSEWFGEPSDDALMQGGEITLTLTLPLPANYSQEQAFPVDLVNVPDGLIAFPQPLPETEPPSMTGVVSEFPAQELVA